MRTLIITVFVCIVGVTNAQPIQRGSVWCLTEGLILDFRYTPPKISNDNKIVSGGTRPSAITDESGNLLLYTDSRTVWNGQHEPLENGTGLNAYFSGNPVTSVIVPHPGDEALYYIFITNRGSDSNNIHPSAFICAVVDVSANNGKGRVVEKNVKLFDWSTALLTVVNHADDQSFWVITHGYGNNRFYAYNVGESGIATPVISDIGSSYNYHTLQMKASPDGTKLAVADYIMADLFKFNAMTGEITDPLSIDLPGATGVEFSPNSELLYVSSFRGAVEQFDVATYAIEHMLQSRLEVGHLNFYYNSLMDMQLAYDGKIYVGKSSGNDSLITIHNPNIKGRECGYTNQGINLLNQRHYTYLPLAVQSYYREPSAIVAFPACASLEAEVRVTSPGYADSLVWDFGDGTIERYSPAEGKIVKHRYMVPGKYAITLRKYIGSVFRDVIGTISVVDRPVVDLGKDTVICAGEKLQLDAGNEGLIFEWATGAESQKVTIDAPGLHSVEVSNSVCTVTDEIIVDVEEYPTVSLGEDKIVCNNDSIALSVKDDVNYTYQWSTGAETANIAVNSSGKYEVTVSNGKCRSKDDVLVTFAQIKDFNLSQTLLENRFGEEFEIEATGANIDFFDWNFGDGVKNMSNSPMISHTYKLAGTYDGHVTAHNLYGCSATINFKVIVPYHLFIPNVVTPNNDGFNDYFEIQYNGPGQLNLLVYNRWGELVYSSDTLEKPWDSSNESSGIYYYRITTITNSYYGAISVLR